MSREERVIDIVHDWMLEFTCHDMWKNLLAGSTDQGLEDMAYGVLSTQKDRSCEMMRSKEVAFLYLTCCLISLKKNVTGADDPQDVDLELFQHILQMMNNIYPLCHSDSIAEKAAEAQKKVILQKLFALCRLKKYQEAEELAEEESGHMDKETHRKIQAVLSSKKKPHRLLDEDSLTDCIAAMTQFLAAVYDTFPPQPLIVQLADHFLKKENRYKGASVSHSRREIQEVLNNVQQIHGKGERTLEKKLTAIRLEAGKAAALSVADTNNNGDSDVEVDSAADGDTAVSDSSRKRRQSGDVRSPNRKAHSASPRKALRSHDVEEFSSECEEEGSQSVTEADLSLRARVPLKKYRFHLRHSLAPSSRKPPSHTSAFVGRIKWTQLEEEEFYKAVQQLGVGHWKEIRDVLQSSRSSMQLKDKWRNICSKGYKELCDKFGPVD